MDTSHIRVQFIRFALLLTVSIALVSVATRINDDGGSTTAGSRSTPTAAPSSGDGSSSNGGSAQPGTSSPEPGTSSSTPGGASDSPAAGGSDGSGSGSGDSGSGGSGSGGSGSDDGSVTSLPRTGGYAHPVRAAALGLFLVFAGAISISVSRR